MIGGIDTRATSQMGMMQQPRENYKMSDEEKTQVKSLLEQYDTENMTEEDTKSLFEEIKSLGVKPGEDLKTMMEDAGVKPPKPPQGGGKPPQGGISKEVSTRDNMPSYLSEFVSKAQSGDISDEDLNTILNTLQQNGYGTNGNIFDDNA